jgi:hypothetical protein
MISTTLHLIRTTQWMAQLRTDKFLTKIPRSLRELPPLIKGGDDAVPEIGLQITG